MRPVVAGFLILASGAAAEGTQRADLAGLDSGSDDTENACDSSAG